MTITVSNGARYAAPGVWADGLVGLITADGATQLAYKLASGQNPPATGATITVNAVNYVIEAEVRHPSTRRRILTLAAS